MSGIAINHRDAWNPSYSIGVREFQIGGTDATLRPARDGAEALLRLAGVEAPYQNHYHPQPDSVRIFFRGGTASVELGSGNVVVETIRRRPLLHTFNKLHYNPGAWWTWFADLFAGALVVIAVTGLFLLRGRHGITRRGGVLVAAGIVLPGILAAFYL